MKPSLLKQAVWKFALPILLTPNPSLHTQKKGVARTSFAFAQAERGEKNRAIWDLGDWDAVLRLFKHALKQAVSFPRHQEPALAGFFEC
jgi:hypothetical protein